MKVTEKDPRQGEELEQSQRDLGWPDVFLALNGVHVKLQQSRNNVQPHSGKSGEGTRSQISL